MSYDPKFIPGCDLPLPGMTDAIRDVTFRGGEPVDHTRFSLLFRQDRGLALCTAHNIDGARTLAKGTIKRRDRFRFDPDVPKQLQVDDDQGYSGRKNRWDRGHLVRRVALHWGSVATSRTADADSYFWTNIAPQHENLHDTPWGRIEDWMLEHTDRSDKRSCVFTGPVFSSSDPEIVNKPGERPVRIPAGFWKIMAIKYGQKLRAAAFLVWQRDFDRDVPLPFDPITEQVRVTTIEYLTGLDFKALQNADPLRFGAKFERVRGRRRVRAATARSRAGAVTCAGDILL